MSEKIDWFGAFEKHAEEFDVEHVTGSALGSLALYAVGLLSKLVDHVEQMAERFGEVTEDINSLDKLHRSEAEAMSERIAQIEQRLGIDATDATE